MPESERRRPRVATCEDWDEDAQTTLPGSQTTANVSAKRSQQDLVPQPREKQDFYLDGGDSGYASRAATTVSDAPTTSSRRKAPGLKLDTTGIPERERKPYHYTQSAAPKQPSRRQSSSLPQEPPQEKRTARPREDHPERGRPDHYARPVEPKQATRATHPPSPVAVKAVAPKASKDDHALPPKTRRLSSSQQPRPVSMAPPNGAYPIQYAMYPAYMAAPAPASGYATPVTPSVAYGAIPFSYPTPPTSLPTPSYAAFPPPPSYFDQLPEPRSARPSRHPSPVRRGTVYGDPVIRQGYNDPGATVERISSKESRPVLPASKSSRSIEVDRANMPPPPRPNQPDVVLARRPSNKRRSQTYHLQEPTIRERTMEPDQYESDDDQYRVIRAVPVTAIRDRRESSSRPPSSFRPLVAVEPRDRPQARKSVSYSAGTTVTKVATSVPHAMPRRMTVPLEQKEADVEEYQSSKRSSAAIAASGLTMEALRKLDQRTSSSKSESGSNFSHQSSSKDSSGRDRSHTTGHTTNVSSGAKTSITLPGGMNLTIPANYRTQDGRPLSINIGGVVVSVAPEGKENERPREQKRIEQRAPSVASRTSKKSAASSVVSNRDVRGRDQPPSASRRSSQLEERGPSLRSSRQPSRAPSLNRRSHDYSSRRESGDYSREYDELYAQG